MFSFLQWKEYFHSVKDGMFHLSPHENILTIALINIHYLYIVLYLAFVPIQISMVSGMALNSILLLHG